MASRPAKKPRLGDARSAARLAAVQALYQREMSGASVAQVLHEFHNHRLGGEVEGERLREADVAFFNDVVKGVDARGGEIDGLVVESLAEGWSLERLDRPMRALLRAGVYELLARPDVGVGTVIGEYVDVAHAFYERAQAGFVNGLLDTVAKRVRG